MALPNEPITRQEMYLSNIAGQNTALPDAPITREEMYLDYIAKNGGTGEGDMKKSIYDSDNSIASAGGIKMFVNQKIGTLPQRVGSLETAVGVLEGEVAGIEDTLDNLGTASTKNAISVVTDSSDLVESGAVKDIVGWGNKNLLPLTVANLKAINTAGTWNGNVYTVNSVTFTITTDSDNNVTGITTSGSASGNANFSLVRNFDVSDSYLSGCPSGSTGNNYYIRCEIGGIYYTDGGSGVAINGTLTNVWIGIANGNSAPANVWLPQIERGNIRTDYEPYHASVNDTLRDAEVIEGKNKIYYPYSSPNGTYNGVTIAENKGLITISGTATQKVVFRIADGLSNYDLPNGDYIASVENLPQNCGIMIEAYNSSSWAKQLAQLTPTNPSINLTVDHDGYNHINSYIYINSGATVNATIKPMIRPATEDATYEPPYTPLKDVVPNKCDNTVIAPVENGSTASQAYAVGEHFIRDGAFCTCKQAISQGGSFTLNTNYTAGDVASAFLPVLKKKQITVTTSANGNADISNFINTGNQFLLAVTAVIKADYGRKVVCIPYLYSGINDGIIRGFKCIDEVLGANSEIQPIVNTELLAYLIYVDATPIE